MRRITPPLHLPGATEFSDSPMTPVEEVTLLKQTAWLFDGLEQDTKLDKNWGRRKNPGSWALAYYAFTVSANVDIEPWWAKTDADLWRVCGFAAKPGYKTVYDRFVELSQHSNFFADAAARLIQHCKRHDANIGCHIHVDGTESETHAGLAHDCQPGEGCAHPDWPSGTGTLRPGRVATEKVRGKRHDDCELPPSDEPDIGDAEEDRIVDGRKRVRVGGCWYRTLDTEAGIRAYVGPRGLNKFWQGFTNQKAIDHYTGAPVAVGVYSASRNEHLCYPDLLERTKRSLGVAPQTVVADRGYSVASVFKLNTDEGIASVIRWRMSNRHDRRRDRDAYDRHGVPRCKHCGGETGFVRFRVDRSGPRLWFRCETPSLPACENDQTISCSKDYRALIPLWRTEPIYQELRNSHAMYERVHRLWRERYKVAGDHRSNRPKRRGLAWQELRAQTALLAEWMRIARRQGWLGSARRNNRKPVSHRYLGTGAHEALIRSRRDDGLLVQYGEAAAAHNLGDRVPPSERGQPPPPRQRGPAPPPSPPPPEPPF